MALSFIKGNLVAVDKRHRLKIFEQAEPKPESQGQKEIECKILKQLSRYFKRDSGKWTLRTLLLAGRVDRFNELATFSLTRFLAVTEETLELEAHWNKLQKSQELQELQPS